MNNDKLRASLMKSVATCVRVRTKSVLYWTIYGTKASCKLMFKKQNA